MIITIDGPAGTGKSTVSKLVAKRLGFTYFDTGAMYRALTWFALHENIDLHDEKAIENLLPRFSYTVRNAPHGEKHHFVGDVNVTSEIRSKEITDQVSIVASYRAARQTLVKIQHEFGESNEVVFEGRDMGTVVFPSADLKIFLTACPEVRAERRYLELIQKFPEQKFEKEHILEDIKKRDHMDSSRKISPLAQAKDAHLIDTSQLSIDEVVSKIVHIKEEKYPRKTSWLYRCIIFWARVVARVFYRIQIYGKEHFPEGGGLVIANHTSFLDPPILAVACPEEVDFLARDSLFNIRFLGALIRRLNTHPVNRSGADTKALRQVHDLLIQDRKVILFPEGSRSKDGQIQSFRSGLGFLAYKAQSKIIPVYIDGAYKIWGKKQNFPKLWGKIRCVVGSAIDGRDYQNIDRKKAVDEITNRAEKTIKDLKQWLEAGAKGSPP